MFIRTSTVVSAVLCIVGATAFAQPQSVEPSTLILFENVRIFDGKSDTLSASMNVLVRGNTIDKISKDPIPTDLGANTTTSMTIARASTPSPVPSTTAGDIFTPPP